MKSLPQVDKVLRHPAIMAREKEMRREVLVHLTRAVLDEYRQRIFALADKTVEENTRLAGEPGGEPSKELGGLLDGLTEDKIVAEVLALADSLITSTLKKVINGTGIILSTNLGRAPLPAALTDKIAALLPGYSSLEIDLEQGQRGERASTVERLLVTLTGCEAAVVVNNCAAAILLTMNALAYDKEVIVSRGELIEIGGSFRLPDVIVAGGAKLREVGTTNRTRIKDYEQAISEKTGLVLKCHRSNFEITGYTEDATSLELKALCEDKRVPFIDDLGSGALLDLSEIGLKHEPTVQESVKFADLVMFSGDKLLGGSQAGLIVGKGHLVKRLRSHPMYRALRLDKLNIALLETLLTQYLRPDVMTYLPVYKLAAISQDSLIARAQTLCASLNPQLKKLYCSPVTSQSAFGGGTTPNQTIPSHGLKIGIAPGAAGRASANRISLLLRKQPIAIISLISENNVNIDLRTVDPSEDQLIEEAILRIDVLLS